MANQLTTRIDVENDTAVVSVPKAARSRILAFAAGAGSQFLAFAAAAQPIDEKNPIFDPASSDPYILAAGLIIGAVIGWYGRKATSKGKD